MKLAKYFPALKHLNAPNVITTFGLVFGIIAAYHLTQRDLRLAIIFLFFASVMDLADGFVASKLKQQTEFGRYLDTLVDFFTCCIMPIWMVHDLLLVDGWRGFNLVVIAALVLYCACGLWRLAYYNIIEATGHFTGLPVPGAMTIVTIAIWCVVTYGAPLWVAVIAFVLVGLLMVSGIRLVKYGLWQSAFAFIGVVFLIIVILS